MYPTNTYLIHNYDRCYRILSRDKTPLLRTMCRERNNCTHARTNAEIEADAENVFWARSPDGVSCVMEIGGDSYMDRQWFWRWQL